MLSLPAEILINILEHLSLKDLESCSNVNKRLRDLSSAVCLPYKNMLRNLGLVHNHCLDSIVTTLTVPDMLRNLLRREDNWRCMTVSSHKIDCVRDESVMFREMFALISQNETSVDGTPGWSLSVKNMPILSPVSRTTNLDVVNFTSFHSRDMDSLVSDVGQDLLVMAEEWTDVKVDNNGIKMSDGTPFFRFLRLSTLEPHPLASHHGIINASSWRAQEGGDIKTLSVSGEYFAFSIRHSDCDRIIVLNWQEPQNDAFIVQEREHLVLNFTYLNKSTIVALVCGRENGNSTSTRYVWPNGSLALKVYRLDLLNPSQFTHAPLVLVFPKFLYSISIELDNIWLLPVDTASSSSPLSPLHQELMPTAGILIFFINGSNGSHSDEEGEWMLDVIVSKAMLLQFIGSSSRIISEWEEWGPPMTRLWLSEVSQTRFSKVTYCHGFRAALLTASTSGFDSSSNTIEVLDFNPTTVAWASNRRLETGSSTSGRVVQEQTIFKGIFTSEVISQLPYYCVNFPLDPSRGDSTAPSLLLLTGSALLVHTDAEDTGTSMSQYDVYSFV